MSDSFQGIVIPILTICGSGVVSAYVTHKLSATNAERLLMLQKLEQLYDASSEYCNTIISGNVKWVAVMKMKIDYNQALDIEIEALEGKSGESFRMAEKLVMLYFIDLRLYWERILEARDRSNEILSVFQADYKESGPRPEHKMYIKPFNEALTAVEEAGAGFKAQAFREAEELQKPKLLKIWSGFD